MNAIRVLWRFAHIYCASIHSEGSRAKTRMVMVAEMETSLLQFEYLAANLQMHIYPIRKRIRLQPGNEYAWLSRKRIWNAIRCLGWFVRCGHGIHGRPDGRIVHYIFNPFANHMRFQLEFSELPSYCRAVIVFPPQSFRHLLRARICLASAASRRPPASEIADGRWPTFF